MNKSEPIGEELYALSLTRAAWLKLCRLRDAAKGELSLIGVCAEDDPLLVLDFHIPKQMADGGRTHIDSMWVATDFAKQMEAAGINESRWKPYWFHTHPGPSATPSLIDTNTFVTWHPDEPLAFMVIVGKGEGFQTTARVRLRDTSGTGLYMEQNIHLWIDEPNDISEEEKATMSALVLPFPQPTTTAIIVRPKGKGRTGSSEPIKVEVIKRSGKAIPLIAEFHRKDVHGNVSEEGLKELAGRLLQAVKDKDDERYAALYNIYYARLTVGDSAKVDKCLKAWATRDHISCKFGAGALTLV